MPPDAMPYTFGNNWFADAPPNANANCRTATVGVLATLHSIPNAETTFGFLNRRPHRGYRIAPAFQLGPVVVRIAAPDIAHHRCWSGHSSGCRTTGRAAARERALCRADARGGQALRTATSHRWRCWTGNGDAGSTRARRCLDDLRPQGVAQELAGLGDAAGLPQVMREDDVRRTDQRLTGRNLRT